MLPSFHRNSDSFAPWALNTPREFTALDITSIVSVRAHAGNPWVLERLEMLAGFYHPAPAIVIVDFGSAEPFAGAIRRICELHGFTLHRVEDSGVFSLSIARNEGAMRAETDLLYFTDIDFFSTPDHFQRLAAYATTHDFSIVRDILLNIPAYHLGRESSDGFIAMPPSERLRHIEQLGAIAAEGPRGGLADFIAPYSNNFLCTRDFFRIAGGYDSGFRGHGSEDFELMVRLALHSRHAVMPAKPGEDLFQPNRPSFFSPRPYTGFRRLGEALSFRAETAGLRAFHLWHPTPQQDPWRDSNDWCRERLKAAFKHYLEDPSSLALVDHLPHDKTALCVCKSMDHGGYFLPFRALGYKLRLITGDSENELAEARRAIAGGGADAFMIYNPYMKSHAAFMELFELAKQTGIEVVVVERGALPATVYYAQDVSYNDPDFRNYDASPPVVDEADLRAADAICERIREGSWTLEKLSGYQDTLDAHAIPADAGVTRVFIPLQLADDMAVTRFVAAGQNYAEFEAAIVEVAKRHPDLRFVVKAHPLNRSPFPDGAANITVCANDENVHAVIDSCDATICYNSGVGLLSLIHGKPTVTVGNAFYNVAHTGHRAASLAEAVDLIASGACTPPSRDHVRSFVAWLVTRKYSYFMAEDDIRQFQHRNSHGYRNVMITQFNWNGIRMPLGRISALARIGRNSYVNGRLSLAIGANPSCIGGPGIDSRPFIKRFLLRWVKRPLRGWYRRFTA
jgi:predicted glycosyltransferase involved in capsule biosynthesis